MQFLKKLFKKNKGEFVPTNRLDQLFFQAAIDPGKRPEFYRSLFHFDLLCLGQSKRNNDGSQTAQFLVSKYENEEVLYAFTSKAALEWYVSEQKLQPQPYLGFSALTLFQMIQNGSGLILNPGHECTKIFKSAEIAEILKDFKIQDHEVSMKAGEEYMIGQPSEVPLSLITSLKSYVKHCSKLEDIYFGLLATKQGDLRYIGVLDFKNEPSESDEKRIFEDLFTIAQETLEPNKIIDFAKLKGSSFSDFIEKEALKSVGSL
jgi:hypothetical protein